MNRATTAGEFGRRWTVGAVGCVAFCLLAACGTNVVTSPVTVVPSASPTLATVVPSASPTVAQIVVSPTLDMDGTSLTKIAILGTYDPPAYATAYAVEIARERWLANFRLTPHPSYIPVLPPGYLTATPQVGVVECVIARQGDPWPHNCWRGYLNGQLVLVEAGTPPGDKAHGIVWIVGDEQDENGVPWYEAPQVVHGLRILSVTGTRMLLAPVVPQSPPITFTFDLTTRQWIGPDGTPLPTPTVTPRATVLP